MTAHTEALATTSNERERDADAAHARTTTMIARGTRPTTTTTATMRRDDARVLFFAPDSRARASRRPASARRGAAMRARVGWRERETLKTPTAASRTARARASGGVCARW